MIKEATGVVLAGGESRRFGSNKALVPWNGKTLVESVVDILAGIFDANLILVKEPEAFKFLRKPNIRVVADVLAERHSLGGIWSALSRAETEHVFVCACDMPFLQPSLLEALWQASPGYDAVIPLWNDIPQPLCGIYSKNCQPAIAGLIKERRFKIQELFGLVRTRLYKEDEVKVFDPLGRSFVDLDTRRQYEAASGT